MRASEAAILIIPGLGGSGPDHLPSARRVIQKDWDRPELNAWRGRVIEEVERTAGPVIFVAHTRRSCHRACRAIPGKERVWEQG